MSFKVGDKVRVYGNLDEGYYARGNIFEVLALNCMDEILVCSYKFRPSPFSDRVFISTVHPKQCRKIKKVRKSK